MHGLFFYGERKDVQPSHLHTFTPSHHLIVSLPHPLTNLTNLTLSPSHCLTLSPSHQSHPFTTSPITHHNPFLTQQTKPKHNHNDIETPFRRGRTKFA